LAEIIELFFVTVAIVMIVVKFKALEQKSKVSRTLKMAPEKALVYLIVKVSIGTSHLLV
jgi:hypothetical protein